MHTTVSNSDSDAQLDTNAAVPAVLTPTSADERVCCVDTTNSVAPATFNPVASGVEGISMTGCGLVVENEEISPAEFNTIFRNVLTLHRSSCWLLGDTLLLAEKRWGSRITGSKYEEAVQATGLSNATIRRIVLTCRRFPLAIRHPELSFTHHQEIAATDADYEQRTAVLEQAASEKMTCSALRKHLHKTRFTEPDEPEEPYDENEEPCKLLDPENPMSIVNLPERSSPDAPPLWDAYKFIDWVKEEDPSVYDLEQCQQMLTLLEPLAEYYEDLKAHLKELNEPETV